MRKFSALAITCAILALPSQAFAAWVNATVTRQAVVYRQANDASEQLGHLREGKVIRVYTPDRSGFYAVNFGKPIKGTQTGWIAVGDVQLADGAVGGAAAAGTPTRAPRRAYSNRMKPSWLDLTFSLVMMSPSSFQTAIGEATSGISGSEFGLTYGHRLAGSNLGFAFGAFYYSVKGTGTVDTYSAKGFGGSAGLDFQFVNQNQFSVSALAAVGMSINSAGNATQTIEFNTSNIIAFPLKIELDLRKYFGTFGFMAGGGYQLASLKEVPVVLQGGTAANPNQTVADFALSGLFIKGGISLNFD
jgi:hypothetical protein